MKLNIKEAFATVRLLAETWPAAFSIEFAGRRPLKVGIDKDILAIAEGAVTPEELSAALRVYCGHKGYLKRLREGAQRIDLSGNPDGMVTANQAANARRHIERIDQRHSERVRARGLAKEGCGPQSEGRGGETGGGGCAAGGAGVQADAAVVPVGSGIGGPPP